jgi:protein-tyrosine phosphatase
MNEVLFVCHANICRSPMAQRLTALAAGDRLITASAGTHAFAGDPMHPGAAAALREVGADPAGHASRPLTGAMVGSASLVLTATREQRAAAATLAPAALARIFTLRQFGRLAAAVDPARVQHPSTDGSTDVSTVDKLERLLAEVALVRGSVQPVPPAQDDLADPVQGTADDLRACVRTIQTALSWWLSLVDIDLVTDGPTSAAARWASDPSAP